MFSIKIQQKFDDATAIPLLSSEWSVRYNDLNKRFFNGVLNSDAVTCTELNPKHHIQRHLSGTVMTVRGFYDYKTQHITLVGAGINDETLLHEMVHAFLHITHQNPNHTEKFWQILYAQHLAANITIDVRSWYSRSAKKVLRANGFPISTNVFQRLLRKLRS